MPAAVLNALNTSYLALSMTFSLPLCRGLYLACIFYKDENVLVTPEDQLPVVEVDDSCSCHAQDLLWFTKVTKCCTQPNPSVEPSRDNQSKLL